ncbi:hypothetical protein RMR21_006865 [Agrobacterium sp. rho-8.1]|nr:hypothetical protein [Agrobacterium sp. rho-8.1]
MATSIQKRWAALSIGCRIRIDPVPAGVKARLATDHTDMRKRLQSMPWNDYRRENACQPHPEKGGIYRGLFERQALELTKALVLDVAE